MKNPIGLFRHTSAQTNTRAQINPLVIKPAFPLVMVTLGDIVHIHDLTSDRGASSTPISVRLLLLRTKLVASVLLRFLLVRVALFRLTNQALCA